MRSRFLMMLVCLCTMSGCAKKLSALDIIVAKDLVIAEQALCLKAGGQWLERPSAGAMCYREFTDVGKACKRSVDCQGLCVSEERTSRTGSCSASFFPLGHFIVFEAGQVSEIYID